MSTQTKSPALPAAGLSVDEDRLVQTLIQRTLISSEEAAEWHKARAKSTNGGKDLLKFLVKSGYLTAAQARRILKEFQEAASTQQIPGYQILEKIGQGSMGTVYR